MNKTIFKSFNISFAFVLFAGFIFSGCGSDVTDKYADKQLEVNIIPKPLQMDQANGVFLINKNTILFAGENEPGTAGAANLLRGMIKKATGYDLQVRRSDERIEEGILFSINSELTELGPEGYTLEVDSKKINLEAYDLTGLIYGVQTIRQLLPVQIESEQIATGIDWIIPCVRIKDKPRFSWRGYMKDVSRTFYSIDVIKKYLNAMALYKLNVLHLHLTDDQGWRIEIKKYPELTSNQTTVFHEKYNEPAERNGYFTQDQIRDLVKYAAERNITIVPEIDLPGHCWPAMIVYPELSVNQKTDPPYVFPFLASWSYWGNQRTPNTFDPTNEKVYEFIDGVFDEIIALFPSEYIHFGGDEVKFQVWDEAPHIQRYINDNGLNNNEGLQNYFVARVCDIIKSKGRIPIGWNDILEGDPEKIRGTAIMSWLGSNAIKEAAEKEFYTVATPTGYTYFDITQADRNDGTMSDLAYRNIISLDKILHYEPTTGLEADQEKYVLGVQANMWTALPREVKDVNVQNFPRLLAIAEIGWSEKGTKDYDEFLNRLDAHYPRLDEMKIDYYRKNGYIAGTWSPDKIRAEYSVSEWDVTDKVYTDGRIIAGFFFTHGNNHLEIKKVELLENEEVISVDEHFGLADDFRGTHKTKPYLYYLKVDSYNAKAKYTLRATVRGKDATDSYGNFTFNLSPYKPFSIIEPHK
ncbi:beta-N-acetylhexosaminidase [candidate division KSB1 bacterium]